MAIGLLLGGACGNDAPSAPADDEPAGEVLRLQGKVTAELGQGNETKTRDLTVGDRVFASETIVTADDSSITIRLFHNNAEWTLGAGKRREVRLSAAWKAPREGGGDLLSSSEDTQTAAAGRHAEREAASTRATAVSGGAPDTEETAKAMPEEREEALPRKSSSRSGRATSDSRADRRAEVEREVAEKGVLKVLGSTGGESGGSISDVFGSGDLDETFDGAGGVGLEGTGPGGGGTGTGEIGVGNIGTIGHGGGGGSGSGYGSGSGADKKSKSARPQISLASVSATGSLASEVVRRTLRQHVRALQYCYEVAKKADPDLAGKLVVELSIDGKGAVTSVSVGGDAKLADAVRSCATARIRRIAFPAASDGKPTSVVARITLGGAK